MVGSFTIPKRINSYLPNLFLKVGGIFCKASITMSLMPNLQNQVRSMAVFDNTIFFHI